MQHPFQAPQGRPTRGFTLLELLLVLCLLVLISLMAWPAMATRMRATELPESAGRIRSALYMARSGAVMEHRRVRVRFETGVQQPIIEIERDPFGAPGVFEQVVAAWTQEPALLGEAQVYSVSLGRPEFLKPVTDAVDPNSAASDAATNSPEETNSDQKTDETLALRTAVETKEDPNRPTILFEPDGSTDWAMVVIARQLPGEDLNKNSEQHWVIVDGRTGMITVREALSEEELADPDLCVRREKLELPPLNQDITETGLQLAGGMPGQQGTQQQDGDTGDLGALALGDGSGLVDAAAGAGKAIAGEAEQSAAAEIGVNQAEGLRAQPQKPIKGLPDSASPAQQETRKTAEDFQPTSVDDLKEKLQNSDLPAEEQQRILDSYMADHRDR